MLLHRQYSTPDTDRSSKRMPEIGRRSPHNQIRRAKPVYCRPDKQAGSCRILWYLAWASAKGSGLTRVCLDWWHSAKGAVFSLVWQGTQQRWRLRKLCYIHIRQVVEWSWMRLFRCIWKTCCPLPEVHLRRQFSGPHMKINCRYLSIDNQLIS